ncbi:flagellar biosynthesis protein FliQ [Vallitalea okinawensis]|uniref:flagellar biosynthesis protein FliQ n=1 Tax=Vallitalea okinawensis TaxID=2078660 RepID=UPI000CFDFD6E|nr:flagellar biosynthesis protein FliQ [Vallitalea okinawensis]
MSEEVILEIVSKAIWTVITTAAPLLLLALSVGLIVSIFQAVTSIQEQTLAFVPKILAVFAGLLIFGPYMLSNLEGLIVELFTNFSTYIR